MSIEIRVHGLTPDQVLDLKHKKGADIGDFIGFLQQIQHLAIQDIKTKRRDSDNSSSRKISRLITEKLKEWECSVQGVKDQGL